MLAVLSFTETIVCCAAEASHSVLSDLELNEVALIQPLVTECFHPPRDQCTFYADCLEAKYHCGPFGYPMGYGTKFCNKFSFSRDKFTKAGQKWMLDTMQCLQNALVSEATGAVNMTCQKLEEKAFASHPRCYLSSGLCELPMLDWLEIVKVVQLETLFQNWDAFKGTVEAAEGCLEFYAVLLHIGGV
ncbi:hypothetical protein K443DRAFT_676526 [Laccaria amethystina LaAM-08-1]|uniref:Uncharacterized protein n=1 Tax=Laccaria amethystina LaAM-08-1 TaxID=1095629 RepID=A0A0C9Y0Z1_9AGAR|nr:hypothetical protein K443DRAFT_676526 [Laccaria amethystina LaAM-08-1]